MLFLVGLGGKGTGGEIKWKIEHVKFVPLKWNNVLVFLQTSCNKLYNCYLEKGNIDLFIFLINSLTKQHK